MKRVLFITPSKSIGGTNSSLSSIVNQIYTKIHVDVLLMCSTGTGKYDFLKNALSDKLLDAYYSDYRNLSGLIKYYSTIIKALKKFSALLHIPLEAIIHKYVARKFQKKYKYDIVVGFSEGIAMKFASLFDAPIKYTWIHCEYDRAVSQNLNELQYYEKFHKIICVSQYTMQLFLNRYPSLSPYTEYIYNLLDINRIISLSKVEIDDKQFNDDIFTIISVGRIDPVKRFSCIPRIASELIRKHMQFVWYIIGGPENEEYFQICNEIEKYEVSKYVILLGSRPNPYPYFKRANLYVSTSLSEACPMVFNEAKLFNLPIVSSDFGSTYEFISDNRVTSIEHLSDVIFDVYTQDNIHSNNALDQINLSDIRERKKVETLFII